MAYTYLGLVNKVNRRVNEVELSDSNFASATGFYSLAKDAVNDALRRINQDDFQWPFNHVTQTQTLGVGTNSYPFPDDTKHIDFDTFRIIYNETLDNETTYLKRINYDEYVKMAIDGDYNSNESTYGMPRYVFQRQDLSWGLYPTPDKKYVVKYEYFSVPPSLELPDSVPTIPSQFDTLITDGALYYVYFFRNDIEVADRINKRFTDGIKAMRSIYIMKDDHVSSTLVARNTSASVNRGSSGSTNIGST
jgi:hypothetical protein